MGDGLYKLPLKPEDVPEVIDSGNDQSTEMRHLAINTKVFDKDGKPVPLCQRVNRVAKTAVIVKRVKGKIETRLAEKKDKDGNYVREIVRYDVDATGWQLRWPNGFSITI